ncbi:hypothetical protein BVRB_3g062990 [Beta vulgaris subsp. vulgaris]|nr:hypothetical protein BVRB_3g062990 [Beta vulgaris subsp. vulgaris]
MTSNSTFSSPTKKGPSFFKVMDVPSTKNHMLRLPKNYVKSYYKEQFAKDNVQLRVIGDCRNWRVELLKESGKVWLSKGWENFVKTYSLKYGYLLLFSYDEKDSEFHVRIFDTTCSEVDYDFVFNHHTNKDKEVIELSSQDEYMSTDEVIDDDISSEDDVAMDGNTSSIPCHAHGFQSPNPHFKVCIGCWSSTSRGLTIPLDYAKVHLKDKHKKAIILKGPNNKKRCYKLKLYVYLENCYKVKAQIYGTAWRKFVLDNELKIKDDCVFELIHPKSNTYKVIIFRAP